MTKINDNVTKKVIRLYKKGYTISDIGRSVGKSPKAVTRILVKEGIHQVKSPLTLEERNEIIESLLSGKTLTDVASAFDVDRNYVRKLVYRTNDTYRIENDMLVIKETESEEQVKLPAECNEDAMTVSFVGKEKDCITTILLEAMIKSDEGNELLRRKGFMSVAKEIESAVEAIIN